MPAVVDADRDRLWLEFCRRQLGQPTMADDDYEKLGHHVYGQPDSGDPAF